MKYIDTGARIPDESVGAWLMEQFRAPISGLRWQTGFFSSDGLGVFVDALQFTAENDLPVHGLVGSNEQGTLGADVYRLATLMGLPRSNANLGVVAYTNGYFHPKVYHVTREDGSQTAYVGSANLSANGLSAAHVEAGVVLDTREGDSCETLADIARRVDEWFHVSREGIDIIESLDDIAPLVSRSVLAPHRVPRPRTQRAGGQVRSSDDRTRPRLSSLLTLPALPTIDIPNDVEFDPSISTTSVPRNGYPDYVLFDPDATGPTVGDSALSGATLPRGVDGLILNLSRDVGRLFLGGGGTPNISIPVATMSTLRFGIYRRKYERPRAEFDLRVRYYGDEIFVLDPVKVGIMIYGLAEGETGHSDRRMNVPTSVKDLISLIKNAGLPVPQPGDYALLEWPRLETPAFRLSFLQPGSGAYNAAQLVYKNSITRSQLIGGDICWLPVGISPEW